MAKANGDDIEDLKISLLSDPAELERIRQSADRAHIAKPAMENRRPVEFSMVKEMVNQDFNLAGIMASSLTDNQLKFISEDLFMMSLARGGSVEGREHSIRETVESMLATANLQGRSDSN